MKKYLLLIFSCMLITCGENSEKDRITNLLKTKIGMQLPFKKVEIGNVENGTAVIVDEIWCYWINREDKIYCVNGASKTIYNVNNTECEDAPIESTYLDIRKLVK